MTLPGKDVFLYLKLKIATKQYSIMQLLIDSYNHNSFSSLVNEYKRIYSFGREISNFIDVRVIIDDLHVEA